MQNCEWVPCSGANQPEAKQLLVQPQQLGGIELRSGNSFLSQWSTLPLFFSSYSPQTAALCLYHFTPKEATTHHRSTKHPPALAVGWLLLGGWPRCLLPGAGLTGQLWEAARLQLLKAALSARAVAVPCLHMAASRTGACCAAGSHVAGFWQAQTAALKLFRAPESWVWMYPEVESD